MNACRLLLLVAVVTTPLTAHVHAQTPGCGTGSTLKDTYSPADTKRAEQFLIDLKAAVQAGDKAKVASMVQYPVRVNLANHMHRYIRTPRQLEAQYAFLFDGDTRKAIFDRVPQCMFARDQGAAIGNGQIWFQGSNGAFKIWSFNHM